MEKRKIQITIISSDYKQEYTTIGTYDNENEIIRYQEKQDIVTNVELNLKNNILLRENKDFIMKYILKVNQETNNIVYLKEHNKNIDVKIKTTKYIYDNNSLEIEYILLDSSDIVNYKIKY